MSERSSIGGGEVAGALEERVRADGLLAEGRAVVVLYSGGRDSTCLLDLAARIAGPDAVVALHLNYGLRDAAGADERHCAELSARLGVQLERRRPPRPARGNVQGWAREQRYRAARELAGARGGDVAAGHTASDQVETILYRLASSPSRRALLGMRAREPLPAGEPLQGGEPVRTGEPVLVRPLLRFTREQTAAYCRERGLAWREDQSNDSDRYARGRIRRRLVPALREIHPAAEANLLALAELLRDEAEVLDELVDDLLEGRREVPLARLRALEPALCRLVVQRLADQAAGRPAPGTARRAAEIVALNERGRAALDLPHGVRAVAERGLLRFELTPPPPPRERPKNRRAKARPIN